MYTQRRLATLFALSLALATAQTTVALKSPDGALELSIATVGGQPASVAQLSTHAVHIEASDGQLAYRVTFRGKPVLDWSNLGLTIQGGPVLGSAVRIESSKTSASDTTWKSIAGKADPIRDHYNAVIVETVETAPSGRRLAIEARAYDDGIAFRYSIPEQPALKELSITDEATQFRFHKDPTTWSLILRDFQTSNEDDYHELTIQGLHPEYLIGLPMLVEVPGTAWIGLTEAYIDDWAGLFLHTTGQG